MVFNNIRKSSIKESHATPTVFIKDQNAVKMRQICQNAKKIPMKSPCRIIN